MKIILLGEAANYQDVLAAQLPPECRYATLPREAASSDEHDALIEPDDVLVALRFTRPSEKMPTFRLLHVPGAGLDGIALDALSPATTVCNVFEHEIPIAEYVLLAMLETEIRMVEMRQKFASSRWSELYRHRAPHGELFGKTVGLIGLGRISRTIAHRAKAFGMRVMASDIDGAAIPGLVDDFVSSANLDRLLACSDYVVIACPLTESTRGMIGAAQLAVMKPSSVLLNISRADIVDEAALFESLKAERIAGAVLDVWYRYPATDEDHVTPANFPFHELPNVICTPHSCAWTVNLPLRRYGFIAQNISRLIAGEPLHNIVKRPVRQ